MKRFSILIITREMQIKMRCHLIPVRMAIIKKTGNNFWRGCREKRILIHCWNKGMSAKVKTTHSGEKKVVGVVKRHAHFRPSPKAKNRNSGLRIWGISTKWDT